MFARSTRDRDKKEKENREAENGKERREGRM